MEFRENPKLLRKNAIFFDKLEFVLETFTDEK